MLLEHFFHFRGFGDKYISYTVAVDVNSLMELILKGFLFSASYMIDILEKR